MRFVQNNARGDNKGDDGVCELLLKFPVLLAHQLNAFCQF